MKFVPLIVSVKAAPPATALFGEMDVIVGVRFGGGGVCPFEPLPPQQARTDTASNKKRVHIAPEKALPFMVDIGI
jgi:hypothetical protein